MNTKFYTEERLCAPTCGGRLSKLQYLIVDVDGTLTDGGIYYDEHGNELKKFNTRDAAGFFCAKICGIKTIILTGRECFATTRRMKELQVDYVIQDVKDKKAWLLQFMGENNIATENLVYIGDDLNDLLPMSLAGYVGCPTDAFPEVKEIADYVCTLKGGEGAVRDFVTHILKERGQWEQAYKNAYHIGT